MSALSTEVKENRRNEMEKLTDYEQGYQDGWDAHDALIPGLIENGIQKRLNEKLETSSADYPEFLKEQFDPSTNKMYPISIDSSPEENNEKHP